MLGEDGYSSSLFYFIYTIICSNQFINYAILTIRNEKLSRLELEIFITSQILPCQLPKMILTRIGKSECRMAF